MKKQGKVKSVSIEATELKEGLQVYIKDRNCIRTIKKIESDLWIESVGYITGQYADYGISLVQFLSKLVVEYDVRGGEGDEKYEKRRGLPSEPYQNQIPLKYSQWEAAIKNGEVDSDKDVCFEIKYTNGKPQAVELDKQFYPSDYMIAKIIPTKKKNYSDEDVRRIVKEIIREADYLDFTPEYGIKGWVELEKALNEKL